VDRIVAPTRAASA